MKAAIFGGTFNPIHKGHTEAAYAFFRCVAPDKLFVIPTKIPPFFVYCFQLNLFFQSKSKVIHSYGESVFISVFFISSITPSFMQSSKVISVSSFSSAFASLSERRRFFASVRK